MGSVAVRKYGYDRYDRSRLLKSFFFFLEVKKKNLIVFKLKDQCLSFLINCSAQLLRSLPHKEHVTTVMSLSSNTE